MDDLTSITPYGGVFGLAVAFAIYLAIARRPAGNDLMREISERIHVGAMAFLRREYSILVVFVLVVASLLAWRLHVWTAVCFVSGAFCSIFELVGIECHFGCAHQLLLRFDF